MSEEPQEKPKLRWYKNIKMNEANFTHFNT